MKPANGGVLCALGYYLTPFLNMLIGWLVYGGPLGALGIASFSLIWIAVSLYAVSALSAAGKNPTPA